ncbi:MAG: hypothetical protein ABEI58_03860 [Candidatus Nanohaloarchaea archaeon]
MAVSRNETAEREATRLFDELEEQEAVEHFFDGQVLGLLHESDNGHHAELGYYEEHDDQGYFLPEVMVCYRPADQNPRSTVLVTDHHGERELDSTGDYKIVELSEPYLDTFEDF